MANGGDVMVRWRARGTRRGDGLGMPPTNREVEFGGMTWLIFKNGLIIEGWDSLNLGRLLESLRQREIMQSSGLTPIAPNSTRTHTSSNLGAVIRLDESAAARRIAGAWLKGTRRRLLL